MAPQDLMFGAAWSPLQLMLVLLVVVLLFGKGKISDLMGDVAKGIKSFKKGMAEEDTTPQQTTAPPKPIEHEPVRTEAKTPAGTETKA
ncbi:MAG TPA: twin-arginine translocase TatA/TatE family subunit [Hyphomicrobiales bacterium]|nr:twin-arginine translocase TatA/TatE family subunit [Hyphomicrobiales bacterium]